MVSIYCRHELQGTSLTSASLHLFLKIFATSSTDSTIKLWDMRKFGRRAAEPLAEDGHRQGCQGAHFAPDGMLKAGFGWVIRSVTNCIGVFMQGFL